MQEIECVRLSLLPPFTTLLVRTVDSLYRIVIMPGPDVYVQGGAFFPEAASAYINAASAGGNHLTVGCICVGWNAEIHSGNWRVTTSPVRAITSVETSGAVQ